MGRYRVNYGVEDVSILGYGLVFFAIDRVNARNYCELKTNLYALFLHTLQNHQLEEYSEGARCFVKNSCYSG